MKILVDADACPVRALIERVARRYGIATEMFSDTAHELHSDYSTVRLVDKGSDSADLALMRRAEAGDIIVTQDYGLAALALSRGCRAIHPDGMLFTCDNIDGLLAARYLSAKQRRSGGRCGHMKRRTAAQDEEFFKNFDELCKMAND